MKPTSWIAVLAVSLLAGPAFSQQDLPASRWINPGGGNNAHGNNARGGGARGGQMGGHRGGGAPSGGTHAAPPSSFGVRHGSVTDPSFAGHLGKTVGGYPATGAPGYGNINFPGGQPGIQPLPTRSGFPGANINYPGGMPDGSPGLYGGLPDTRGGRRHRGRTGFDGAYSGQVIYYGVPYYVPVYTEVVPVAPPAPEPPRAYDIREYQAAVPGLPQPQHIVPSQPARTVTLLAFKDSMVIAVTDYWMQAYSLVYETSLGVRTVVPLDRLDWGLTQQLNFERNVPFVLEARP